MGSQATRDADGVLFTRAGLEVSVAATKTFVCQVAVMYLLALRLAETRGTMEPADLRRRLSELKRMPHLIDELLETVDVDAIAEAHHESEFFLYLGRHVGLPVALEGALKLKEISYISTDAYAAGEMKHGPIALLDESTPVFAVATDSPGARQGRLERAGGPRPRRPRDRDRSRGQRRDRRARRGGDPGSPHGLDAPAAAGGDSAAADRVRIARLRGLNVDQPRNLAKTVTVE